MAQSISLDDLDKLLEVLTRRKVSKFEQAPDGGLKLELSGVAMLEGLDLSVEEGPRKETAPGGDDDLSPGVENIAEQRSNYFAEEATEGDE